MISSRLGFLPGTTAAAIARAACRASGASRAGLWRSPLLLLEETTSAAAFRIKAVQILAAQAEEYVTKRVEELSSGMLAQHRFLALCSQRMRRIAGEARAAVAAAGVQNGHSEPAKAAANQTQPCRLPVEMPLKKAPTLQP